MLAKFYQNNILKKPSSILILLLVCLCFFGYFSKNFRLDASSETLLIEGDPDLKYFNEVNKTYGAKEFLVLTYTPNEDRCENGLGKIRGMSYNTCEGGIDSDGDGEADAEYVETDGYPSSITITDQGEVIWGSSNFDDNSGISTMSVVADPFKGTKTMMIREVF